MLCYRTFLVARKFMEKKGEGEYRNFPSKCFRLKVSKKFLGESFTLSLVSGIETYYASEGYVTIFRRNFFCLTVPKHFGG